MSAFEFVGCRRPVAPLAKATGAWAFVGLAAMGGCGPDHAPSAAHPDAQAVCPVTPEETIGVACGVPGLRCGPQFTCGALSVSLVCTCTDGIFQCIDGKGSALAPGDVPTCPRPAPTASCPLTESGAQFVSCTEPGLLCAYASACRGRFDSCQCFSGQTSGGFALRFECTAVTCSTNDGGGVVIDSGVVVDSAPGVDSQAGTDASGDAPSEAPGTGDGPVDRDTSRGDAGIE